MSEELTFVKDVTKLDWVVLPRPFIKGEKIIRFHGHTYGLERDDALYLDKETIPCCLIDYKEEGNPPFFTVPVELLVDDKGEHPQGSYLTSSRIKQIRAMAVKEWKKP